MNCPSILQLTTTDLASDRALRTHVEDCLRCQALLRAWQADPLDVEEVAEDDRMPTLNWTPRADPGAAPVIGAIQTINAPRHDVYLLGLVVDLTETQATVFPISTDVHQAGDWDVILDEDQLGYPAMVEAWNAVDLLAEQLIEQVATADPEPFIALYDSSLSGAEAPTGIWQGPSLDISDDPRHLFREYERERVRPYAEPARVVTMGETLGEILYSIRSERALEHDELAIAAGIEPLCVTSLEEGRLDIRSSISVKDFGRLLWQLDVAPSEEFYGRVEEAVFVGDRHVEHQTLARGRKLQLIRRGRAKPDEEDKRARARAWVEKLRAELAASR